MDGNLSSAPSLGSLASNASWQLPATSLPSNKSWETILKEVEETEESLVIQAKKLPGNSALAEQRIREMAKSLRDHISELKGAGKPPEILLFAAKKGLNEMHGILTNFLNEERAFGQGIRDAVRKVDGLKSNIDSFFLPCSFSSIETQQSPFPQDSLMDFMKAHKQTSPPNQDENEQKKTAKELMSGNLFWASQREDALERIYLAQAAAGVVNTLIEEPIKYATDSFCQFNSTTEKVCETVSENVKKIELLAHLANPAVFMEGLNNLNATNSVPVRAEHPKGEALANHLEQLYLIPKEQGLQYSEDAFKIAPYFALAAPIGGAAGIARKQIAETAVKRPIAAIAQDALAVNSCKVPVAQVAPKFSEASAFEVTAPSLNSFLERPFLRDFLWNDIGGAKLPIRTVKKITLPTQMPIWSGKEWKKKFEEIGYIQSGGKGGHLKLKKADCPMVNIPVHQNNLSYGVSQQLWKVYREMIMRDFSL